MSLALGQKVRSLRQQLGLSQQQLAGQELTRAFISLVEQGKCTPSTDSLTIIARRLGKPIEYFLKQDANDESETVELLTAASQQAFERGELATAVRLAAGAVKMSERVPNGMVQLQARENLYDIHFRSHRAEAALEQLEEILELHKARGDRGAMAHTHLNMTKCYIQLEEFGTARRHGQKALRLTEGKKSLRVLRARVCQSLGHCHYLLGDLDAAIQIYRLGIEVCRELMDKPRLAMMHLDAGVMFLTQGQWKEAQHHTELALHLFAELRLPLEAFARHNLAVIYLERHLPQQALPLLEECLQNYRQQGDLAREAQILDELSRYHFMVGKLDLAEQTCEEALRRLDLQDDGVLRGRVYRMLGRVARARGNHERAAELLRISVELFRRIKAADLMNATLAELSGERTSPSATPAAS